MKKVFLIDDDPIFVFLAERLIKTVDVSLNVEMYADGELAMNELDRIEAAGGQLPNIILLDLNMPVMDGWQFLEYYSSVYEVIGKKIAIYILSSTISPEDVERSKRYSFVLDLLIKPIRKEQVVRVLKNP